MLPLAVFPDWSQPWLAALPFRHLFAEPGRHAARAASPARVRRRRRRSRLPWCALLAAAAVRPSSPAGGTATPGWGSDVPATSASTRHFLRFSFARAMQFRFDFFFRVGMDTLWYAHYLAFFGVLYHHTELLGGWTCDQVPVFAGTLFVWTRSR